MSFFHYSKVEVQCSRPLEICHPHSRICPVRSGYGLLGWAVYKQIDSLYVALIA